MDCSGLLRRSLNQHSARLVARFGLIVTEELTLANLVRAPKARPNEGAAADEPQFLPNAAAAKAGLNSSLLDAARTMLRYAYEGAWWDNNGSGTDPGAQTAPRNSIQAQAWVE